MAPKAAAKSAASKPAAKPKTEKKEKPEEPETPKVAQPDRAAFDEKVAAVNTDIEKLQQQQSQLTKEISGRSGGKDDFFTQKAEIRKELDVVSAEIDALHKQKEQLLGAASAHKQEGREMRDQLNKMKQNIGYGSVQEIDERIATIEFKLHTESVSLKEEKKLIEEIKQLKKNRPKVTGMNHLQETLQERTPNMDNRAAGMEVKAQIALCMERKKKIHEKLTELNESRKAQLGDLPQLIEKRDGISKQIGDKIKERNQLRDEFREEERNYREYQNELRQLRQKKAAEEREARQREWNQKRLEREAEKLDDQPYVQEITLIEQTISFCKSLTQDKGDQQKEEAKEINHNNPEGTMILLSKDKRDEEFFFAPTAKGKKGKSNKAKDKGGSKPIKHNAETFKLFEKLKLDAPITTEEIPALLEKLETQLEDYQNKVKEWELKREEMKRKILEDGIVTKDESDDEKGDGETKDAQEE
jgi:uncharacterized coiled-coil DUF342 family protein